MSTEAHDFKGCPMGLCYGPLDSGGGCSMGPYIIGVCWGPSEGPIGKLLDNLNSQQDGVCSLSP